MCSPVGYRKQKEKRGRDIGVRAYLVHVENTGYDEKKLHCSVWCLNQSLYRWHCYRWASSKILRHLDPLLERTFKELALLNLFSNI